MEGLNKKENQEMKKLSFVFLVVIFVFSCATTWIDLRPLLPDLTNKPDGVYRGKYDVSKTPISVVLDATLSNGRITHINIIKHSCSPIGKKAEKITERIISEQSLSVDVISGATASSKGILMAVENALQ